MSFLFVRYYFHLHNDIVTHDEEGVELSGSEAALNYARQAARIMASESVKQGHLDRSHYIEVADDARTVLSRVTFGDVVTVAR